MSESIIVGVVIGVVVAGAGAIISHYLRKREMEAHWAEEERRRKSDRRRELYERDLKIVNDVVNALVEVIDRIEWSAQVEANLDPDARLELGREVHVMAGRANVIALSLDDQELDERLRRLIEVFNHWTDLLDLDSGEAEEGIGGEFEELQEEVRRMGAEVWRRTREILEEV